MWATVDQSAGRAGIKSFLVEKGTPGFEVAQKEKKLGIRGRRHRRLRLQRLPHPARPPARRQRGGADAGAPAASAGVMKTFNMTRPAVAAFGIGIAEAAPRLHPRGAREGGRRARRTARRSARRSAVAERFLELEALHEAAKLTVFRAAWLAEQGQPNNLESSVCKADRRAPQSARSPRACIEILGPDGHLARAPAREVGRATCRIIDIYEGTGQIQRLIIARDLLGYGRNEAELTRLRARRPSDQGRPTLISPFRPTSSPPPPAIDGHPPARSGMRRLQHGP